MSAVDIVERLQSALLFVRACKYPDGLDCHCDPSVGHQCELCVDKDHLSSAIKEIERCHAELAAAREENERLRAALFSAGHYLSDDCYQRATAQDIIHTALGKDGEA